MQLLSNLSQRLFPRSCFCCGRLGSYLCLNCRKNSEYADCCYVCKYKSISGITHLSCGGLSVGTLVLFHYSDSIKRLLRFGKFYGGYSIYEFIGNLFYEKYCAFNRNTLLGGCPIITYVPLYYSKRIRKRGYNQSFLLANALSKKTRIPIKGIFKKIKITQSQSTLGRSDRLINLIDSFILCEEICEYTDIILVDDVITTGSTLDSLACLITKNYGGVKIRYVVGSRGG